MMNKALIITSIILSLSLTVVGLYAYHQKNKVNDLEADLTHLNNSIDRMVDKRVNDAKAVTTDSLIKVFESKVHDTIIKNQIIYKYDTITKVIHSKSYNDQYRWSANELDRLHKNGLGVRFKSGVVN